MEHSSEQQPCDLKIQSNYPNLRSLIQCRDRLLVTIARNSDAVSPTMPGYLPPCVRYLDKVDGNRKTIQVRELDLPLLCDPDERIAIEHLQQLLRARGGEQEAIRQCEEVITRAFGSNPHEMKIPVVEENEFVVPCTTQANYSVDDISHKGAVLLKLSQQGYPVPDFTILTSKNFHASLEDREKHITKAMDDLGRIDLPSFGSTQLPLVFALRCAMPVYIPGVMYTFLNVGVTEKTLLSLIELYGEKPAKRMFINNLRNYLMMHDEKKYESLVENSKSTNSRIDTNAMYTEMLEMVRKEDPRFLADPYYQACYFVSKAYADYYQNFDLLRTFMGKTHLYPSVILQKMVCTVRHQESHAGVLFSRHPQHGVGMQLQLARDIFGEDIMTGTIEPEEVNFEVGQLVDRFPGIDHFIGCIPVLEEKFASPTTIEYAVEGNDRFEFFALLQLNCSELSGRAAFLSVMDLYRNNKISRQRVIELIRPYHFTQIESDTIDSFANICSFSQGVSVLPRFAISAQAYFSSEEVLAAKKRGEKVCFFKERFQPSDTVIMREMDGIVCGTPAAIHVVTICQGFGIPALLNLAKYGNYFSTDPIDGRRCMVNLRGQVIREGDWVTISSLRQMLYIGRAKYRPARFVRYMLGEQVELTADEGRQFEELSIAYREYQRLVSHLELKQIAGIRDLIKLVRYEIHGDEEKQQRMVNQWYDGDPQLYLEEVFNCEMGAHLNQQTIYRLLTLDRQIRFFKMALSKCVRECRSGISAGCFILGRLINTHHPIRFWDAFLPDEVAMLLNEWVMFEKYMEILSEVGEQKLNRAQQKIDANQLKQIDFVPGMLKGFMTLKLSSIDLEAVKRARSKTFDEQFGEVIENLLRPYGYFYKYDSSWSIGQLKQLCEGEGIAIPAADDL